MPQKASVGVIIQSSGRPETVHETSGSPAISVNRSASASIWKVVWHEMPIETTHRVSLVKDMGGRLTLPVAHRHAGAHVLLHAVLREGIAKAVLGQGGHAIDRLDQVLRRRRHQH